MFSVSNPKTVRVFDFKRKAILQSGSIFANRIQNLEFLYNFGFLKFGKIQCGTFHFKIVQFQTFSVENYR